MTKDDEVKLVAMMAARLYGETHPNESSLTLMARAETAVMVANGILTQTYAILGGSDDN